MKQPTNVLDIFSDYGAEVSRALATYLTAQGESPMYGMMRYFMGFADESFAPMETFAGKRFRSGLCLLIADGYGVRSEALHAAVSLELFHNFTLIHDDIFDRDAYRRGRKTVWNIWGDNQAINTGDAQSLLATGALIDGVAYAPERYVPLMRFLTECYLEVLEGQHLDLLLSDVPLTDSTVNTDAYLAMTYKKTAVLVGAATKAAGLVAECSMAECDALYTYGTTLGLAYQLCDDMVSVWGDGQFSGKATRGDLKEKKKTIPVLYGVTRMTAVHRERFEALYASKQALSEAEVEEAYQLIESTDAYRHTRAMVDSYAQEAKKALIPLSLPGEVRETLRYIVDALLPNAR